MKKLVIILVIGIIILAIGAGTAYTLFLKKVASTGEKKIIENPLKQTIIKYTDKQGQININAVVDEGIKNFNTDYINYLLIALGIGNLHNSAIFGNPIVELSLDGEVWNAELNDGALHTAAGTNENKDLIIIMSKQEAVKALISPDIKQFMKDSVVSGRTQLQTVAGNPELLDKGYLDLYNNLK